MISRLLDLIKALLQYIQPRKKAAIILLSDLKEKDITIYIDQADSETKKYEDYDYIQLLTAENGCMAGCRTGLLMYVRRSMDKVIS